MNQNQIPYIFSIFWSTLVGEAIEHLRRSNPSKTPDRQKVVGSSNTVRDAVHNL